MKKINLITDSLHGTIRISELEKTIISMPAYNRLHGVLQNSTVYLTFPSNHTSRFEHSIGTMHLCGEMFYYGICNATAQDQSDFLNTAYTYFTSWIEKLLDEDDFKFCEISQTFNEMYSVNEEAELKEKLTQITVEDAIFDDISSARLEPKFLFAYQVILQSIRIVALLHDLGHPPFSHVVEYALNAVVEKVAGLPRHTNRQKHFTEILKRYANKELHEAIGCDLTRSIVSELRRKVLEDADDDLQAACEQFVYAHLIKRMVMSILYETESGVFGYQKDSYFACLHALISGTMDGDRLDYASRDPRNSGIDTGKINYSRLLSTMALVRVAEETGTYFIFVFHMKNLPIIEDFLIRRWRVYKDIVFHHRVVKTDTLLQSIIRDLSLDYLGSPEPETGTIRVLPTDISGLWKALSPQYSNFSASNMLIQWDDHWLLTILKHAYISDSRKSPLELAFLEEFLSNRKHFYSYIKSASDFNNITQYMIQELKRLFADPKIEEIREAAKNCNRHRKPCKMCDICASGEFLTGFYGFYNRISRLRKNKPNDDTTFTTEIIMWLETFFNKSKDARKDVRKIIAGRIHETLNTVERYHLENNIGHAIVEYRKPKFGVDELYLYRQSHDAEDKYTTEEIGRVSRVVDILVKEAQGMPPFYIFLKSADREKGVLINDQLEKDIGVCIAASLCDIIANMRESNASICMPSAALEENESTAPA